MALPPRPVSVHTAVAEPRVSTIKTLEARPDVYKSRFVSVAQDLVEFPNGVQGEYNVITMGEKKGALIVPVAYYRGVPHFGLVEQYRYPVKQVTLEFPRGGAKDLEAEGAAIEIQEELGQPAKRIDSVGSLYPDTGILATEVGVWIALMDGSVVEQDHTEEITGLKPRWVNEGELLGLLSKGAINCGMTMAGFALWSVHRNKYGMFER